MLRLVGLGNKSNKIEIVPRHWNSGAQSNCSVFMMSNYGKSLCYAVLPYAFDEFRGRDGSIAIIVSPLKALMKNRRSLHKLLKDFQQCTHLERRHVLLAGESLHMHSYHL